LLEPFERQKQGRELKIGREGNENILRHGNHLRFGVGVCFGADTAANHRHAGRTAAVAERDGVSIDANYQ